MSYGKVKATFWTDGKMRRLPDDAKMLALYLLTGPHRNILGCMRIPSGYIIEDLGWSADRVADAMRQLCESRFISRDDDGWTLIMNQLRHDPIKVPNHAKAAIAIADTVPPESPIYRELVPRFQAALDAVGKSADWHPHAIGMPSACHRDGIGMASGCHRDGIGIPLPSPLPSPSPLPEPFAVEDATSRKRAARLLLENLPDEWRMWCSEHRPDLDPDLTWQRFHDHWVAKPGKDGRKLDWLATWRNWCRNERLGPNRPPGIDAKPRPVETTDLWRLRLHGMSTDGGLNPDAETARRRILRQWSERFGPPPGSAGCRVPVEVLAEFGFGDASADR